jgi:hypothetical protein
MIIKYIVRLMVNSRWETAIQCDTEEEVNTVLQVASEDKNIWYERYMIETRQCEKGKPIQYGMPINWEYGDIYHMQKEAETRTKGR